MFSFSIPRPQQPWVGLDMKNWCRERKSSTSSRFSPVTCTQSRRRKSAKRALNLALSSIEKLNTADFPSLDALYERLLKQAPDPG